MTLRLQLLLDLPFSGYNNYYNNKKKKVNMFFL